MAVGIACQRWPCRGAEVGPGCKETAFAGAGGAAFDDDNSQCIISSSPMEKHQADIWWSGGSFGVAVPITFLRNSTNGTSKIRPRTFTYPYNPILHFHCWWSFTPSPPKSSISWSFSAPTKRKQKIIINRENSKTDKYSISFTKKEKEKE